ncbi:uncharacterized protein [Macrobrachium rosenbergii]|uniref:uncharacterized protein n=1 Tax=Macrobrachium rosenbergii TaxID=79674 RepID=UPI0034D7940C
MNWVGGVRRRVLLKEEERCRQEQFFASHAASAKLRGLRNSSSKNMRKDQMLDVSSSSTQRPVKLGGSHLRVRNHEGEDIVCAKIRRREPRSVNSKDLRSFGKHHNQECNRITDSEKKVSFVTSDLFKKFKIKPSSVHGPFSRYLLQLELEGVQKKIEDQKKNQQKDLKARRSRTNKKAKTSKDTWQCKEDLRAKQSCLLNETKNGCSVLNLENGISQETKNDVRTNISDAIDNVMKDPHKYRKESKDQVKSITGLKVIDASDKKEQDNLDGNEDHQVRSFREAKLNKVTHSSGKFVHSSLEISKDQEVRSVTGARINKIDAFKHKSTLVVHDYLERSINQDGQNITGTNRHEIHDSRKNTKVMNINEAKHRNLEHNYFENCEDQEVENIKEKSINEAKHKNLQHEYIEVRNLGANANVAQPSSVQGTHKFDDRTYGRKNSLTNKDMKTQNSSGLFGNDEEPNEAELSQEDVSSVGNQRKDSREAKRCTCDPRSIPAEAPEQAVPNIKNYAKFHCIDQNTGNKIENKDDVGNYIRLESNDYPHSYESICKCLPTKKPLTKKARKEEHEKHHQSMETNKETNNKKSNQEHVFSKIHRGIKSNAGCLETHSDEDLDSKSMNENPLVFDIDEMFGNRGGAGHSSRQTPLVDTPVPIEEKGTNHLKLPFGEPFKWI